ncbi:N-acetylmuramoyl-L-alanine amidase [Anderseniella sp. Alg231-50]|uniref:N-acetylmuramoyl-L-alanine amidase n=1 Tax=Anderseniella sp. Alg231-50 TaxID=1922226 RepID=UPI000D54BE9C
MSVTGLPHELIPATNFSDRVGVAGPDILLLHYTGVPTPEFAIEILTNGEREVSCHYLVRQDGGIVHMVDEDKRAWHAGKSSWEGAGDINSRSVGIEICNPGHGDNYHDFPDVQIEAVIALGQDIVARHAIEPRHVLAHSDVAPGRKIDPGEKFPWARLASRGIGLWVTPAAIADGPVLAEGAVGADVSSLQQNLAAFGYGIDVTGDYDGATATVVRAFQLHFRPELCDGRADVSTLATLAAVLAARSA